ncbi:MAG: hypothetical protein M3R00_10340 [Pseudomonadota bacterium]|nr:hypothetical protein [Pseudomonadota bacterium]
MHTELQKTITNLLKAFKKHHTDPYFQRLRNTVCSSIVILHPMMPLSKNDTPTQLQNLRITLLARLELVQYLIDVVYDPTQANEELLIAAKALLGQCHEDVEDTDILHEYELRKLIYKDERSPITECNEAIQEVTPDITLVQLDKPLFKLAACIFAMNQAHGCKVPVLLKQLTILNERNTKLALAAAHCILPKLIPLRSKCYSVECAEDADLNSIVIVMQNALCLYASALQEGLCGIEANVDRAKEFAELALTCPGISEEMSEKINDDFKLIYIPNQFY